ncbi:MAG: hypothetical protein IJW33_07020 [Lentisphaeria bacterium]|nr:hypothetical protein [Lentisphaeria bacterium]
MHWKNSLFRTPGIPLPAVNDQKRLFFDQGFDLLTLAGEISFAPVAFLDLVVLLSHI